MPPVLSPEYRYPAEHLVAALDAAGVSQSELARRLWTTQGTVNRWCRGKAPITRLVWLACLHALGLPVEWEPTKR